MRYQLYKEQQLKCDIETAWEFFSSPYNLSKITSKIIWVEHNKTSPFENEK